MIKLIPHPWVTMETIEALKHTRHVPNKQNLSDPKNWRSPSLIALALQMKDKKKQEFEEIIKYHVSHPTDLKQELQELGKCFNIQEPPPENGGMEP